MSYQKRCKRCGKEFETRYPSNVYCSIKCRDLNKFKTPPALYEKKCKNCGKSFLAPYNNLYCSTKCRAEYLAFSGKHRLQLCWTCQKATGYCSWSASLKPIPGWDAKLVKHKDGGHTYRIKACPQYEPDDYITRRGEVKK